MTPAHNARSGWGEPYRHLEVRNMLDSSGKAEVRVPEWPFSWLLPVATALLVGVIFVVDINTPLNFAFGMLYVAVVLLASRFCSPRNIILVGGRCIGLTGLVAVILGGAEAKLGDVSDVLIAMAVIAFTTVIGVRGKKVEESFF